MTTITPNEEVNDNYKPNSGLSPELAAQMFNDRKIRTAITRQSHFMFFHFYFAHYVKYATAPFQRELFHLTERQDIKNLFVVAFRGSAKSTIFTTSYPVWAILGEPKKKFVLILCQTQAQAKQHMMNLRRELENNTLLKNDLGPFQEENNEWGSASLVFSRLNARITAVSSEQSIRGLRHNQHRPDLIIGDDLEDLASTKTREGRNKTYQWLTGEVVPAGDRNTRLVIIGNLLHEDSLLMRLKEDVDKTKINGLFKAYPLIQKGVILWPGKYPSMADIEDEKSKAANEFAWQREYLLHIVPAEDQAIHREWIQYYDKIPRLVEMYDGYKTHTEIRIGIDPAISKNDAADYTAIVPALLFELTDSYRIYILPKIINKRMSFPETVETCKLLDKSYGGKDGGDHPKFVIEDVAYQKALPQQLNDEGIWNVMTTRPGNQDKRSRLVLTANMIKSGKILFPKEGAEQLIQQIVHFGVEKHDDLADAFANLVHSVSEDPPSPCRIYFL
jgi:predicted phage terminase large subunit-like protein